MNVLGGNKNFNKNIYAKRVWYFFKINCSTKTCFIFCSTCFLGTHTHLYLGTRINCHVLPIFCPARSIPGNFKRCSISEMNEKNTISISDRRTGMLNNLHFSKYLYAWCRCNDTKYLRKLISSKQKHSMEKSHSIPRNSIAPEEKCAISKGKDPLPTIHFVRYKVAVRFRESFLFF